MQLLNKGRFLESKEIDNIPVVSKKSRRGGDDDMDVDGDEEPLSEEEYIQRLDTFVEKCLRKHVHGAEDYKTTVVNDERKRIIADFYRRANAKKKCENCSR